ANAPGTAVAQGQAGHPICEARGHERERGSGAIGHVAIGYQGIRASWPQGSLWPGQAKGPLVKTEELIETLSTNLPPVHGGELRSVIVTALAGGAIAALCLMLVVLGVPVGVLGGAQFWLKLLALAFTLGLVGASANLLVRLARPGDPGRKP